MWARAMIGAAWLVMGGGTAMAAERLVLEPYPGAPWYDVVNQSGPGGFVREQMPQGQTPQDPQDVLTAQSVSGYQGTPAGYIAMAFGQLARFCDTVETVGPTSDVEDGHQVAYGRFYCGKQKDKPYGGHVFFKAIQGSDRLYVIDRDFRIPASEHPSAPAFPDGQAIPFLQAEATAKKYLSDHVYICDPVFPEARCTGQAVQSTPR